MKIKAVLDALKEHLRAKQDNFYYHNSWAGDTVGGFYTENEFDFDKMFKEMDEFGEELRKKVREKP